MVLLGSDCRVGARAELAVGGDVVTAGDQLLLQCRYVCAAVTDREFSTGRVDRAVRELPVDDVERELVVDVRVRAGPDALYPGGRSEPFSGRPHRGEPAAPRVGIDVAQGEGTDDGQIVAEDDGDVRP